MNDGTQQLPEGARLALIEIAQQLREGFTGEIYLQCKEGNVPEWKESRIRRTKELADAPG